MEAECWKQAPGVSQSNVAFTWPRGPESQMKPGSGMSGCLKTRVSTYSLPCPSFPDCGLSPQPYSHPPSMVSMPTNLDPPTLSAWESRCVCWAPQGFCHEDGGSQSREGCGTAAGSGGERLLSLGQHTRAWPAQCPQAQSLEFESWEWRAGSRTGIWTNDGPGDFTPTSPDMASGYSHQ